MYIDSSKRINLFSLKNIDIWLSYGSKSLKIPYKGICFLAIAQPFLTNWAEIFNVSSGDYYLSIDVKNPGFGPYLL